MRFPLWSTSSRRGWTQLFEGFLLLVSIFYTFILVIILSSMVSQDSLCETLKYLDSSHTCRPSHRPSRPQGCSSWGAFHAALDRYALAHVAGWFTKALLHPHRATLWHSALLFEAAEYVLSEWMPFLKECWWDRFVLDILVCNIIGMELGIYFTQQYNFTYYRYHQHHYQSARTARLVIAVTMVATDVNFFLIRESIHLRMQSYLQYLRCMFFIALTIPASRQLVAGHIDTAKNAAPLHRSKRRSPIRDLYRYHLAAYVIITVLEAVTMVRVRRGPYTAETPGA